MYQQKVYYTHMHLRHITILKNYDIVYWVYFIQSNFHFFALQSSKTKLNAQSQIIRVGVVCIVDIRTKIKQEKSNFPLEHENLAA